MNDKMNKILTGITIAIISISAIVFVSLTKSTYSVSDKYVVFKGVGQHDEEIIRSCKIGTNGKLESSCVDDIGRICGQWSKEKHLGSCTDGVCTPTYSGTPTATFKTMTFSDDDVYYCVGGTSTGTSYFWGCYVCDADETVMKWFVNVNPSDSSCPGNSWHKDTSITDDKLCKPPEPAPEPACYKCDDDYGSTWIWTADESDVRSTCGQNYEKVTSVTKEDDCVAPEPPSEPLPEDACYKCKDDSAWVWGEEEDANTTCKGKYEKVTSVTTSAKCKPSKACYECKADKNIVKWDYNGLGDNNCQGGYSKTTKTQAECKPTIVNPPTGSTKALIACFIAFVAMGFSLLYLKKSA